MTRAKTVSAANAVHTRFIFPNFPRVEIFNVDSTQIGWYKLKPEFDPSELVSLLGMSFCLLGNAYCSY
jgi:hypothetical protein